ncbi:MAG: ribosomal-protein-alanine N-acetyltransferase [Crocinitomix sp.]|jgi:ribosomal-protein-alanine N-acetyltransferase
MKQELNIRPLEIKDIPLIADYWLNSDPEFLYAMGVDLNKLPSREDLTKGLTAQLAKPINERQTYALIWLVNKAPIGHCNVNPFVFGEEAFLHLHIWNSVNRTKGIGLHLVQQSIEHFFETLEIKRIISEPYAQNPSPNKTLAKLAFKKVKTYRTIPGSLNFEQEVNRWVLER